MAHKCTVTRRDGKYHLECEECGLITAQPANRGGLVARGERHEASNGQQGGPKGAQTVVLTPRDKARHETLSNLAPVYGELPMSVGLALALDDNASLEPASVKAYKRPAFNQAQVDNKCQECGGPLLSPEGGFCTTSFPVRAVCRGCKQTILEKKVP